MADPTRAVRLERVLCPTDFSDFSAAAVSTAAAVAASFGARVRLLHVITPFPIVAPYAAVPGDPGVFAAQRDQAARALAAEAARVGAAGVPVDTECRTGPAVREVLGAAADFAADLVVVGTHGRGGFERLVLGSVTEKLVRRARCAVLTVPRAAVGREAAAVRWSRILCAHDGSAASQDGVDYAVALAERTGAALVLVSVVEALPYGGDFTSPAFAAFHKDRERHAIGALDRALEPAVRTRLAVSDRVVYGKPWRQILETAGQEGADLLVLGVQGRGAVDLAMFGSTANEVVRHAEMPVLTVRRTASGSQP
ncbi:MAG: universal stress protein [Vicinamibacterales bacterium]